MQYTKQVMNKTIRLYSCLLLSLVLLGACSKDRNEPQVPGSDPTENTYNDGPRVTLSADSEVDLSLLGQAKQDSRVDYMTSAEGTLTLKLPTVGTKMKVHCIIKSTDPAQPTTYATLNWVRRGTSGLYYDYNQAAFSLATGSNIYQGEWYIAGMIGGTLDASAGTISFAPKLMRGVTDGQVTDIDAPFYFPWQRLKVVEVNGQPSLRVESTVTFKPQGTLFRHNISNDMYNAWDVSQLKVATNVFTSQGAFTFPGVNQDPTWTPATEAKAPVNDNQKYAGAPEKGWSYVYTLRTNTSGNTPERLPSATPATETASKISGNNQRYYLSWGMPVDEIPSGATPRTLVYADITAVSAIDNQPVSRTKNTDYHVFFSDLKPEKGKSYLVRSVIRRPPLALEYMAEFNLAGPKTFATSHAFMNDNRESQAYYFSVPDHATDPNLQSFTAANLPEGWHVPSGNEAKAAIPTFVQIGTSTGKTIVTSKDKTNPSFMQEQIRLPYRPFLNSNYENIYTMHHYTDGQSEGLSHNAEVLVYGLRSMTAVQTSHSNIFMSAWTYEFFENIAPETESPLPALVIRARYLGPVYSQTGAYTTAGEYKATFQEVANRDWWDTQSVPKDDEAEAIIPLPGYVHTGKQYLVGKLGVLMLQETVKPSGVQPTVVYFRPAKMGVRSHLDAFYYSPAADVTSPYPADAPGTYPSTQPAVFYPIAEKLKLTIRPFKSHDFLKPYLERRPRP